jgi:hypothetical protein
MKKYKKVLKETDELEEATCDKCGALVEFDPYKSHYDYDWFDMTTGHGTPDGGGGFHYKIDLCEKCGMQLIDWLKNSGYEIKESEWDY